MDAPHPLHSCHDELSSPHDPLSWIVVAPIIIAVISRLGLVPLQNWPIAACRAATAPVAIVVVAIALPAGAFVLSRHDGVVIPKLSGADRSVLVTYPRGKLTSALAKYRGDAAHRCRRGTSVWRADIGDYAGISSSQC